MDTAFLPDTVAAAAINEALVRRGYTRVIRHASGRPWIVGTWRDTEVHVTTTRGSQLALFGRAPERPDELLRALCSIRTFADADNLHQKISGSYLTAVTLGNAFRVHGTLAATHEVFYTTIDGIVVAANNADLLRRLAGSQLKRHLLPLLLLAPRPPWPLSEEPLWEGVHRVPSAGALTVDSDRSVSVTARWSFPVPRLPLADIASRLRAALRAAVEVRSAAASVLGADLSGGLDSTTLAFFADERARRLVTVTQDARDITNDDSYWAQVALDRLQQTDHLRIPAGEALPWYTNWDGSADGDLGSPYPALRTLALNRALAARLQEHGVSIHLTGLGGDELFSPSFAHLHALVRRSPLHAIAAVRRAQAMGRWSAVSTLRALALSTSHTDWMQNIAGDLDRPLTRGPNRQWEPEPRLPAWATQVTQDACRTLIRDGAKTVDRQHVRTVDFEMLRLLVANGRLVRRMSQTAESHDVAIDAPYLDDAIIELAFQVRFEDRVSPGVFKPVLQAAAPANFPEEMLGRRSKGDYSAEAYAGLNANRASIVRHFDDASRLHEEGLINAGMLRKFLTAVHPSTQPFRFLDVTLSAETWLRDTNIAEGATGGSDAQRTVQAH